MWSAGTPCTKLVELRDFDRGAEGYGCLFHLGLVKQNDEEYRYRKRYSLVCLKTIKKTKQQAQAVEHCLRYSTNFGKWQVKAMRLE